MGVEEGVVGLWGERWGCRGRDVHLRSVVLYPINGICGTGL